MNTRLAAILFLTVVASLCPASNLSAQVTPVTPSTAVTYQGRLNDGPAPANGSYDFEFSIFNANGLFRIAGPLTLTNVPVSNSLFTVHLDFDPDVWASPGNNARLLEVAVRTAGTGDFNPLSPRHPITAAPFAVRTLGVSGNSLSPPDGSPDKALVVDNDGNVGIGTTITDSLLTVGSSSTRGTLNVVGSAVAVPVMTLSDSRAGGRQYSIYGGLSGVGTLDVFDQSAAASRLTIGPSGNVGIGVLAPGAKLDVRGDIRFGTNSQLWAVGGDRSLLRIIEGRITASGRIIDGSAFTVFHNTNSNPGFYQISFIKEFAVPPVVTVTVEVDSLDKRRFAMVAKGTRSQVSVKVQDVSTGNGVDNDFSFIAIGQREFER